MRDQHATSEYVRIESGLAQLGAWHVQSEVLAVIWSLRMLFSATNSEQTMAIKERTKWEKWARRCDVYLGLHQCPNLWSEALSLSMRYPVILCLSQLTSSDKA